MTYDLERDFGVFDEHRDLASLPPKERASMRRLRNWLSEKLWAPLQSICILSGFDPEVGPNRHASEMAFLPGAFEFFGVHYRPNSQTDWVALDDAVGRQIDLVRGLDLTTSPPKDAIKAAVSTGIEIPWLFNANEDQFCRAKLPLGLRPPAKNSHRAYAKLLKDFPDWIEQTERAYALFLKGKSRKQILNTLATEFEKNSSGMVNTLRRFEQGESAKDVTRPFREFLLRQP